MSDHDPQVVPEPPQPTAPKTQERKKKERQCRICLGGEEEVEELGRLIKPCHCKGSIRYVHVKCINTWRKSAANTSAFWQCPQCEFHYAFARTKILGLSTSPWVLGPTTLVLFILLVFSASSIASYFLPELHIEDPTLFRPSNPQPPPSIFDAIDDPIPLGWSFSFSPFGIASDIIKYTVETVAEANANWVREVTNQNADSAAEDVYDANTGAKREDARDGIRSDRSFKSTVRSTHKKAKPPSAQRQKARDPRTAYSPSRDRPSLWIRLLNRFILGLSLVGIISFFNILLSLSLVGPFQVARARFMRGRRGRDAGADIGTILVIVFVAIGVIKALWNVYTWTKKMAKYLLLRAENAILEVQGDDDEEEEELPSHNDDEEKQDARMDKPVDAETEDHFDDTESEQGPNKAHKPPRLNLHNASKKTVNADEIFGDELPDTPGGWQEQWNWDDMDQ